MKLTYTDFEFRAWKSAPDQIQVMVHSSPAGDMRQPVPVQMSDQDLRSLTRLNLATSDMSDAVQLGTQLGGYLLPPDVTDLLDRSLAQLTQTQGLRLRLCLDAELADVPWEFLRHPNADLSGFTSQMLRGFLALDPRISIVRAARRAVFPTSVAAGKQRLAFFGMVDADPHLKIDEEFQGLRDALAPKKEYLDVERISQGDGNLESALSQPTAIFHYAGWAVILKKDGPGYLARTAAARPQYAAAQPPGKRGGVQGPTVPTTVPGSGATLGAASPSAEALISCTEISQLLQRAGARLVSLSTCYSARWAFMEPLVGQGVPAAIGVLGAVFGEECVAFFNKLYDSLAVGLSLDEAVTGARHALLNRGASQGRDADTWGQFVIYMPTDDPVLLPQPASPQNQSDQDQTRQELQGTIMAAQETDKYTRQKLVVPDVKSVDLKVIVTPSGDVLINDTPVAKKIFESLTELEDDCDLIRREHVQSREFYANLGSKLFEALGGVEFQLAYLKQFDKVPGDHKHILRVSLVSNSSDMAEWPWEYLYDRNHDLFLGSDDRAALSRRIPVQKPRPLVLDGPLRVLAVISNPDDLETNLGLDKLKPEDERENLEKALIVPGLPASQQPIELEFLGDPASDKQLRDKLGDFKPNVLHFIGHGVQKDGFQLVMANDDNRAQHRDAGEFAALLRGRPELRMVVLVACNSGAPEVGAGMTGLAPTLLQNGIPAVLVMQHSLLIEDAQSFSLQFYNALRDGNPVDYAVSLARRNLRDQHGDQRAFGTPVLYTLTPNLFKLPKPNVVPPGNARALMVDRQ